MVIRQMLGAMLGVVLGGICDAYFNSYSSVLGILLLLYFISMFYFNSSIVSMLVYLLYVGSISDTPISHVKRCSDRKVDLY